MHSLTTCGCSLVAGMYFCCYCHCYCSWCLSFVFVGIMVDSVFFSPFFCAKIDNDRKLGNWKHRALLNTKILVNTKPSSDYEYRDIQIDEWIG